MTKTLLAMVAGYGSMAMAIACSSPPPQQQQQTAPTASATASTVAPVATTPVSDPGLYTTPTAYDAGVLPIADAAIGACTVTTGKPLCDQCITTSCCTQVSACDSNPDCVAADDCTSLCAQQYPGNPQYAQLCANQCYQQHPTGGQLLNQVYQCVQTACVTQCQ